MPRSPVTALAGTTVDLAFDAAPVSNALPGLLRTVATPEQVLTLSDFAEADKLGVKTSAEYDPQRYVVLGEYVRLASEGRFSVPVARTFPLEEWQTAME